MKRSFAVFIAILALSGLVTAKEMTIKINLVTAEGVGNEIGTITATDTPHGLLLTPKLRDLPPGLHGFHLHEKPTCEPAEKEGKMSAAEAAGSHLDPNKASKHAGPYAKASHLGDLPPLYVTEDGQATLPVLAPRLKTQNLNGHSVMIHEGGDNYSDQPKPLGGGGARIACGVVQ
jgi:Cu-Zn family superoxide dismutase